MRCRGVLRALQLGISVVIVLLFDCKFSLAEQARVKPIIKTD